MRIIIIVILGFISMGYVSDSDRVLRTKEYRAALDRGNIPLTWECNADEACEEMLGRRDIQIQNIFPCSSISDSAGCIGYAEIPCDFNSGSYAEQEKISDCGPPKLLTIFMEVDRRCRCHIYDIFATINTTKMVRREVCEVYNDSDIVQEKMCKKRKKN